MKICIQTFLFWTTFYALNAQQAYFQQEVNYKINVELFDSTHILKGDIAFEYINHSPDTLTFIYVHLWPNAFKNKETAYAKQELVSGSREFYFAVTDELGYIKDLSFQCDNETLRLEIDKITPDIARLILKDPLLPGAKSVYRSPFTVKIPVSYSRLGHVGQSYQVTQWYPKPAVYDSKGWHPISYLDQGEFYSEFGSFDVTITLPENYVVGATGTLMTPGERIFLQNRINISDTILKDVTQLRGNTIPPSSMIKKTIRYAAEKVHDFAWFADKRFYVQKSEVILKSGKKVDTWVMFTNVNADLWTKAINYVNRSVAFYSERVGEYPYPQATAVQSALSAGGGMEYPMITVIGEVSSGYDLDIVITHEVGHNWFYGILASNERDHAWMDEGLNSFYEQAYSETYYPDQNANPLPGFMTRKVKNFSLNEMLFLYQARRNLQQACNTTSGELTSLNYGLCAYLQPAWNLQYLEAYLGQDLFEKAMKTYYERWKFKHPYPENMKSVLEEVTGKNLSWLFDDLFGSVKKNDYAVTGIRKNGSNDLYDITLKNKGKINAPVFVASISNDSIQNGTWIDGFSGQKQLQLVKSDQVQLDPFNKMVTFRRNNDIMRTTGLFRKAAPLTIRLLPAIDRPDRNNLFWLPLIAYNQYDHLMAGVVFYNGLFPFKNMDFYVAPLYSSNTGSLSGVADIRRHIYTNSKILQKITFAMEAKSFHFDLFEAQEENQRYIKFSPSVELVFHKKAIAATTHAIKYRQIWLREEFPEFDSIGTFTAMQFEPSLIHELSYHIKNTNALSPYKLQIALERQQYTQLNGDKGKYLRLTAEWDAKIYYDVKRTIQVRLFAGYFIQNTGRNAGNVLSSYRSRGSLGLSSQGFNDYKYDDYYFGRNESSGFGSHKVGLAEGGMKFNFGSPFANTSGFSNDFLVAMNLKAKLPKDLPLKLPLKPYLDAGYFHNTQPTGSDDTFLDQFFWSAGVTLDFDILSLYFPIVQSKNLENLYAEKANGNYLNRITFSLKLASLRPGDLLSRISF